MIYDKRNISNINKLAINTRKKAMAWYEYCKKIGFELLIYETIRTKEKQLEYYNARKSLTMKSYHLVGQALDFVPINKEGKEVWNGYNSPLCQKAIRYAIKLGFTWGGHWKGFIDSPHLQYEYYGYGSDTFKENNTTQLNNEIEILVQKTLRGEFGNGIERKNKLGSNYEIVQKIINDRMK